MALSGCLACVSATEVVVTGSTLSFAIASPLVVVPATVCSLLTALAVAVALIFVIHF